MSRGRRVLGLNSIDARRSIRSLGATENPSLFIGPSRDWPVTSCLMRHGELRYYSTSGQRQPVRFIRADITPWACSRADGLEKLTLFTSARGGGPRFRFPRPVYDDLPWASPCRFPLLSSAILFLFLFWAGFLLLYADNHTEEEAKLEIQRVKDYNEEEMSRKLSIWSSFSCSLKRMCTDGRHTQQRSHQVRVVRLRYRLELKSDESTTIFSKWNELATLAE